MTSLSAPVQAVLELFQGPLADVRFADVDAAGLANLAAAVDSAASEVAQQEAQLAALRQTLVDRQDALLLLTQRAVAYARVYAEHDEALTEQLSRIVLPRATKPRKAGSAKAPGESTPVEAAPPEIESATVAPTQDEPAEAQVEESAPAIVGSRKTKRRLGPPRDAAQSRPS
jgi:hypothetical protein